MALKKIGPAFLRRADDDTAFERLYDRHAADVYRYAAAMLGAGADAEDVTQTTFLNAYRAFKKGTRPDKPHSWLITIAHNVCRQRFRQAQRRPHEVAFDERVGEGLVDDVTAPKAEDLRRALSQLAPNQRAAIVMRELEGSSYAEIASVLGISVSALETLLFRARRALREQLEEQLTCEAASFAINKQLDGRLSLGDRRALRAHLRACTECHSLAQSQRAQSKALKALVLVPLPVSISHWMGGQSAAAATGAASAGGLTAFGVGAGGVGVGVAAKVAAVVVAGAVVGGGTYEGVKHVGHPAARQAHGAVLAPGNANSPAATFEYASATGPAVSSSSQSAFETPKRTAPQATVVVIPSTHANAKAQAAVNKDTPAAQGNSQATPPGQTAREIAHTPVAQRASTPGQAVKALRSAAPSKSHPQQSSNKKSTQPAQAQTSPSHPEHPAQSQSGSHSKSQGNPHASHGPPTTTTSTTTTTETPPGQARKSGK